MKYCATLAFLFIVVAFSGATNSQQTEVDEELQIFDLLDDLSHRHYNLFIEKLRDGLQEILNGIKSRIGLSMKFETIWQRINQLQESIRTLVKLSGIRLVYAIHDIKAKLQALLKDVLDKLKSQETVSGYAAAYDLQSTLIQISDIVSNPAGIKVLKSYLERLQSNHPVVHLIKDFVAKTTESELLVIVKEFFSGLNYGSLTRIFYGTSLVELFGDIREEIQSPEGLSKLREYARNLQTSHPIVLRIKAVIEIAEDDAIRSLLGELFKGLD